MRQYSLGLNFLANFFIADEFKHVHHILYVDEFLPINQEVLVKIALIDSPTFSVDV